MTAKTKTQIEEMKNQTIGVEVEMNSITRENAAKLAAEFFGTHGRLGTRMVASGSSRGTSASRGRTARSANWSHRFSTTQTSKRCRSSSADCARQGPRAMQRAGAGYTFTSA